MKTYKRILALNHRSVGGGTGQMAMAQSTIFNIPTTDTVAKGKGYFEFDYLGQLPGPDGGNRYDYYMPRGIVGLVQQCGGRR